jgi:glycosidase
MAALNRNYPKNVLHSLMNILGTHDTLRILTALSDAALPDSKNAMEFFRLNDIERGAAIRRLKLASLLQFTLPGVPCVFYGDEAGMEGCADPFNRRCYPWGKEDKELVNWYRNRSMLRKSFDCFKDGSYELIEARDGLFAFIRGEDIGRVIVAVNTTGSDRTLNVREVFRPWAVGSGQMRADASSPAAPELPITEKFFDIFENEYTDTLTIKAGEPGIFTHMKGAWSDGFKG